MSKLHPCPHCALSIYQYETQCPHCQRSLSDHDFSEDTILLSNIQAIYGAPPWLMVEFQIFNLTTSLQYSGNTDPLIRELQSLLSFCDTSTFPSRTSFSLEFSAPSGRITKPSLSLDLDPNLKEEILKALLNKTLQTPISGSISCTVVFEY